MFKLTFALILMVFAQNILADDYDKVVARLKELDNLPNTTLFSLGKNDQNQDILGLVLGDASSASLKQLVVGTHHGNEKASAQVPLEFIEKILPALTNDTAYFVIPVLNISGFNKSRREETGADAKWHDANRDYEDACQVKKDFQLKSTALLAELVEREDITAAVTVHGYIGTFTYPWGTNASDYTTKDDAFMKEIAQKAVKINNYKIGTHGAAIYPAAGAFEDWAYFKHGVWSFLMEIRSPGSDLKKDAATLVEFFKFVPHERSRHVGQKVNCLERILNSQDRSRP